MDGCSCGSSVCSVGSISSVGFAGSIGSESQLHQFTGFRVESLTGCASAVQVGPVTSQLHRLPPCQPLAPSALPPSAPWVRQLTRTAPSPLAPSASLARSALTLAVRLGVSGLAAYRLRHGATPAQGQCSGRVLRQRAWPPGHPLALRARRHSGGSCGLRAEPRQLSLPCATIMESSVSACSLKSQARAQTHARTHARTRARAHTHTRHGYCHRAMPCWTLARARAGLLLDSESDRDSLSPSPSQSLAWQRLIESTPSPGAAAGLRVRVPGPLTPPARRS